MNAAEVIAIAKTYAPYAAMASSALLCIADAEELLTKSALVTTHEHIAAFEASAKSRALDSLRYSCGISSEVYKRCAA